MGGAEMLPEGFDSYAAVRFIGQERCCYASDVAAKLSAFEYFFNLHSSNSSFCFHRRQLGRHWRALVIAVQRVAAGRQAVARSGCTIAKGPANSFVLHDVPLGCIPKQPWICKDHAPESDQIAPPVAQGRLRSV